MYKRQVSFSGIVNEVNTISSIVIGGDVTATVANNVVEAIKEDTTDAGRNAAFTATRTVIDNYNLHNNPFFGTSPGTDSRSFIETNTLTIINQNITNTCRVIEQQTGRTIIINGFTIDPNGTSAVSYTHLDVYKRQVIPNDVGYSLTLGNYGTVSNNSGILTPTDIITKVKVISGPQEGWMGRAYYKQDQVQFQTINSTSVTTLWNFHNYLSNFDPWSGGLNNYPYWGGTDPTGYYPVSYTHLFEPITPVTSPLEVRMVTS